MSKRIAILPGDGIGPEVTRQGLRVLTSLAAEAGLSLETQQYPVGGAGLDESDKPLPVETLEGCHQADAILLGAVGGPKWADVPFDLRPEKGLLDLRSALGLYANLRPARIYGDLVAASSLKSELVAGCDLMVVRELTGGIYFGEPRGISGTRGNRVAHNTMHYSEQEIERIVRTGFDIARKRKGKLCSVDKANVLEVSVLWREIADSVSKEYPDVRLEHMYVDNAAMQLVRQPLHFDTIVTGNLFGDILSDVAAMLTGSIGMLPSASTGAGRALYEPVHGSAPDLAGQDLANPLASILSVGMMFRYSLDLPQLDERIEQAVISVLADNRTDDIHVPGKNKVGCESMGDLVLKALGTPAQVAAVPAG